MIITFKAMIFYAPKTFWDLMEEGKIKAFTNGVKAGKSRIQG